jgi:hypothetical protein
MKSFTEKLKYDLKLYKIPLIVFFVLMVIGSIIRYKYHLCFLEYFVFFGVPSLIILNIMMIMIDKKIKTID